MVLLIVLLIPAPILSLVQGIANVIDEKGLKATATGKLPQKLCKVLFEEYRIEKVGNILSKFLKVSKEDDFYDLQVARLVMELTGLLRKTKGRFFLTKKYNKVMSDSGTAGLYPILFAGFCTKFNWAYADGYDEIPFIQHSFLFSMYMLHKFGNTKIPLEEYQTRFLQAFPMVIHEVITDSNYCTEEEECRRCYSHRALDKFLWFMGLANIEHINNSKDPRPYQNGNRVIEKLPLLNAVVQFNFQSNHQ